MLPLVIGCVLTLGASALAVFLDRQTEAEQQRQADLKASTDAYRRAFFSARAQPLHSRAEQDRIASELCRDRAQVCHEFAERMLGVRAEFEALKQRLQDDLADASISPYRRNALRLLRARLEDAFHRVDAFRAYADWYVVRQDALYRAQDFDALFAMENPRSRAPEDWYYIGKVGLIAPSELGVRNAYGQLLELRGDRVDDRGFSDAFQRALLLQYPEQDQIPVQLFGRGAQRFAACVLRGALHVEHIMAREPCAGIVDRFHTHPAFGDGYVLRCFPAFYAVDGRKAATGGVRAFLPRSESRFPGKSHVPGERIDVLMHHYDLLLTGRELSVTQQPESLAVGTSGTAPIILAASAQRHDLAPLHIEAERSPWHLQDFSDDGKALALTLQLGPWRIDAQGRSDDARLLVTAVEHVGIAGVDVQALPFSFRLIDERLAELVHADGLRFDEFRQFCRQQKLFGEDEAGKRAAAEFFQRWSRVTDYLLEASAYQTFVLSGPPPLGERDEEWDCTSAGGLGEAVEVATKGPGRPPRLHVEALYSGAAGERWLQIAELKGVPEALGGGAWRLPLGGARPPEDRGFRPMDPPRMRLRIPNGGELANLGRQKRALQAFMSSRMINRKLQQILLMPERYRGEPDPAWARRVEQGLAWQDPNWQDPDKARAAKRIVEAALVESNLHVIQGPPGTGKTTCIVELLQQIYAVNPAARVLVVSQQNTAVDNALGRFLKRYKAARESVLRISGDATKVEADLQNRVTDAVLGDYLRDRQQDFSQRSALGQAAPAAWIKTWMDRIHRQEADGLRYDEELTELLIADHPLVGATCVGLASRRHGVDRLTFDVCIIDEGGRCTVPELLIPMMRSRKVIIIGDHFQLPPSVARALLEAEARQSLPFLEDAFLKTSFFEQLYERLPQGCKGRLEEQFRMVEPIGDLVAELFYSAEGQRGLFNGLFDGKPHDRSHFLDPRRPLRWHDVPRGRQEKDDDGSHSLRNVAEAEALCDFIGHAARTLRERAGPPDERKKSIAVITPYGAQKRLIQEMLSDRAARGYSVADVLVIDIDTVDGFQGSEADIVLYSTVRTWGNISFLLDRQRLNVACSRARENLVFFGCAGFLARQEEASGRLLFSRILSVAGFDVRRAVQDHGHASAAARGRSRPGGDARRPDARQPSMAPVRRRP